MSLLLIHHLSNHRLQQTQREDYSYSVIAKLSCWAAARSLDACNKF